MGLFHEQVNLMRRRDSSETDHAKFDRASPIESARGVYQSVQSSLLVLSRADDATNARALNTERGTREAKLKQSIQV